MSLSAPTLGSLIDSNLAGYGANGSNRTIFSNAIAAGIVMSISGKSFATLDAGSVPGFGAGSGVGLTGLNPTNMTSTSISIMPSVGVNANNFLMAIMNAVVTHLSSSATLTSTHTPVFAGVGTIVIGSIPVSITEMKNNIDSQLSLAGAVGSNRTVLSNVIATGIVTEILNSATGTVVIVGSPSGTPSGGSGAGVGVIS
jgi:hypothetical protein